MEKYINDLLDELKGEENSFILNIRCKIEWKHDSFIKLVRIMRYYCSNRENEEKLDKNIAEGFWFVSWFIKDWTSHENFRKTNKFPDEYFNKAYEIIFDLCYWYFTQECIFISEDTFNEEINELEKIINI
ncbi:MAG: hypothetical protein Q8900_02115 [Bacillota bacterium]|nr:hypothetical protein [Bacillota bacterium]